MGSRVRHATIATFVAFAITACTRVTDAPPSSQLGQLVGRCIKVSQPLLLIDGDDAQPVNTSLAPVNQPSSAPVGVGRIEAGDKLTVERVLLKRTFGDRYSLVVGRTTKYPVRHIALFYLLDRDWRRQAEDEAFDEDRSRNAQTRTTADALDRERARWCN